MMACCADVILQFGSKRQCFSCECGTVCRAACNSAFRTAGALPSQQWAASACWVLRSTHVRLDTVEAFFARIAGVPNAVERLDREGLKVIQTTAGKWKRTIDPFQQPTEEAMEKAKEEPRLTSPQPGEIGRQAHSDPCKPGCQSNLSAVLTVREGQPPQHQHRGALITSQTVFVHPLCQEVATGEVWFGADALEKGLVDVTWRHFALCKAKAAKSKVQELKTSSEYLLQHMKLGHEVLSLTYNTQSRGLGGFVGSLATASEFAEALGTDMSEVSQFAKLVSSSWPSSLPQPRVQAQGPLGSLGDRGF